MLCGLRWLIREAEETALYSLSYMTRHKSFFKWAVRTLKITSVQIFCPGSVNILQIYNENFFVLSFLLSLFESFNSHVWGFVVWERQDQQSSLGSVFIYSGKNDKLAFLSCSRLLEAQLISNKPNVYHEKGLFPYKQDSAGNNAGKAPCWSHFEIQSQIDIFFDTLLQDTHMSY